MSETTKRTCEYTQTEILEKDLGSTWKCSACNTVEVHAGRTMPYKYCPYCAAEIVRFHKLKSVKSHIDDNDPMALEAALMWLMRTFPGSFINSSGELILDRETNVYFNLKTVSNLTDLRCKVIEYVSRAASKTEPYGNNTKQKIEKNIAFQTRMRKGINQYLGTEFNQEEWLYIYTYLGNGVNRPLCERFVDSGYDLEVIRRAKGNR